LTITEDQQTMNPVLKSNRITGALALVMLLANATATADTPAEAAVKAAVVHKITKFVAWPDTAFASRDSPIRFCVAGQALMFDALQNLAERPIQGRPVHVVHMQEPVGMASNCDVLYLSPQKDQAAVDWLQPIADSPVLTFGESGKKGADGSIVRVSIRRDKVRFAINTDASDRAGLSISAQLLQLAAALGSGGG
jgi:hypothetical protein